MQQDMKTGIALGLALVGIVGALFFRREPATKGPPALTGAAELDRQISDKPKAPYIQGLDEYPDIPPAAPATTPKAAVTKTDSKPDAYRPPAFLTKEDEAEHREFLTGRPAPAPDPIAVPGREPAKSTDPASRERADLRESPAHNRDWQPVGSGGAAPTAAPRATASDSTGSARTHVIQPGDTLSGIAARYLGNSGRFREIYDANRKVLRSPDDLPDGATIVIPEIGKAAQGPTTAETAGIEPARSPARSTPARTTSVETTQPAVSGTGSTGQLRFAPVPRGPLSAGRVPTAAPSGTTPRTNRDKPRSESHEFDPFEQP